MNQTTNQKTVRPAGSTFAAQGSSTSARAAAQFEAARRNRIAAATPRTNSGTVVAMKDSAPGLVMIGVAIAEAVFVEPIRGLKRKFRRSARTA